MTDQTGMKLALHQGALNILDNQPHIFSMVMPGGAHLFVHAKSGKQYLFVDPLTGEERLPLPLDLEYLLGQGRWKPEFMAPARNAAVKVVADVDIEAIISRDKDAPHRQSMLRIHDDEPEPIRYSDNGIEDFYKRRAVEIREAGIEKLPSPSTLRRWLKARGLAGDRPLAAMVNMSGRVPRNRNFDPRVEAKIKSTFSTYWNERERAEPWVVDEIQAFADDHNEVAPEVDKLKKPSAQTIRNRLRKSETAELYKLKFGDKAFRTKYRTPCDRRLNTTQILETVIVDHTVIDTMLVLSARNRAPLGRPTLALMVDVASRAIVAFYITFDKPSFHTAAQLLKRAVRPKSHLRRRFPDAPDGAAIYGLMSSIVFDRALETIGVSERDALADLGIEVVYAGAAQPQAKGIVERLFRTLNDLLFHRLRGSVPLPASLMREMGYDPAKTAVVTIEELEELLEEAINVYHYQVHGELQASPVQYWLSQNKSIYTLPDPAIVDKMAGMTITRTLDRQGIQMFYLQYCCEKNVPILLDAMAARERTRRGKRKGSVTVAVKVKFNPEDLSRIYVFNYMDNQYYELKCTDPAYAEGTSLWQHREIRKFAVAQANSFRMPEQRREMRLALARRIADAAPEIGLKRKRDQKKLEDAFANDLEALDQVEDLADNGIRVTPAAASRADGGRAQHSPQRGKSARRRNVAKRKGRASAPKAVRPTPALVAMTEELRTAAAADWRAN